VKSTSLALKLALALLLAMLAAAAWVWWLNVRGEAPIRDTPAPPPDAAAQATLVARGAYLARAGNCMTCHTARGGRPYAGGRGIDTPFGTVYAGNLTPDRKTGLGDWNADHFYRALHHGRARDGRLLYPAFPYPSFTQVTRADADALFAYLGSLAPVEQARPPHRLRFPYGTQAALAVWRALFFRPHTFQAEPAQGAEWNRGAYLVRGLGHCSACHAPRNALGATTGNVELAGGLIPMQNWYAPSLTARYEAGVQDWSTAQVVALLKNGVTGGTDGTKGSAVPAASVQGPMADVVLRSTQYLSGADLQAMAVFLKALPDTGAPPLRYQASEAEAGVLQRGGALYSDHCAQCHGERGEGKAGAYPPLAGNRAAALAQPANLVRIVANGGYLPATAGNPRPFGMPPYAPFLSDADIAAVLSYVRQSWGNRAPPVSPGQVARYREAGS
jgi:mono/diheme cytochrome c family protein